MVTTAAQYARYKTNGICSVCKVVKAPEGFATCETCREARKARRTALKKARLCTSCKAPVVEGLAVCKKHQAEQQARQKAVYAERTASGLCPGCGAASPTRLCETCKTRHDQYDRDELRQKRIDDGVCVDCGLELAMIPFQLGPKCREKNIAATAAWREKGDNAETSRKRVKTRRATLVETGVCGSCGRQPLAVRVRKDGTTRTLKRCTACLETNRIGHLLKRDRSKVTAATVAV